LKITSTWNGTTTQSGQNVSITNASYNATIPGSTTLGFQGTWTSSDAPHRRAAGLPRTR
jgi:hypothetical protein